MSVPHVLDLLAPPVPAPLVSHVADLDALTAYLADESLTLARHGWFHGESLNVRYAASAARVPEPLRFVRSVGWPPAVALGVKVDRSLITLRQISTGKPLGWPTYRDNPRLKALGVGSPNLYGLLTDWVSLPPLDPSQPWIGHDGIKPQPDDSHSPLGVGLSDISNPIVEALRLRAALEQPGLKGAVERKLKDALAGWEPIAADTFNVLADAINAAIAEIQTGTDYDPLAENRHRMEGTPL